MKYNICIEDKSFVSCARNDEKSKTFATGTVRLLFSELPLILLIRKGLKVMYSFGSYANKKECVLGFLNSYDIIFKKCLRGSCKIFAGITKLFSRKKKKHSSKAY